MNIESLPTPEWVIVTPEIASEMLVSNTHNRNLKAKRHEYAEDMRSGDWRPESCDPLRFAHDGTLLDGQNRLHAVIEAEAAIPFLVVRGLPTETQAVMDSGVPRKFSDVLKLREEDHYTSLAAVVRLAWEWERGVSHLAKGRATTSQLLRFLEAHPEIRDFANHRSRAIGDSCHLPSSIVGCLWWVFDNIDPEDAGYFFERLGDDTGHAEAEPIYELRRTLKNVADAAKGSSYRNRVWLMAVTIKAWNAYRAGQSVSIYRWRPGGKNPERFPEPK